jgi:hypothetical protein
MSGLTGFIGQGNFDLYYNFATIAANAAGSTETNYRIGNNDLRLLFCPLGARTQSTISTGYRLSNSLDLTTLFAPIFTSSYSFTAANLRPNGRFLCLEFIIPGTYTISFTNGITASIIMIAGGGSGGSISGTSGTGGGGAGTSGIATYTFAKNTSHSILVGAASATGALGNISRFSLTSGAILLSFPPGGVGTTSAGGICGNNTGITANIPFTQYNAGNAGRGATNTIAGVNGDPPASYPVTNGFQYFLGGGGAGGGGTVNAAGFRNGGLAANGTTIAIAGGNTTPSGQTATNYGSGGGGCAYSATSVARTPGAGAQGFCAVILDLSTQT